MITLERDASRAIGVRPAVSAVIFDRRGRLLLQQRSDGGQWGMSFECVVRSGALQTCDETLALEYFPPRRLPSTLLAHHRIRIRDASTRRVAPYIR